MIRWLRATFFTSEHEYSDQIVQSRADAMLVITGVIFVILLMYNVVTYVVSVNDPTVNIALEPVAVVAMLMMLVLYGLTRRGFLRIATWSFVAIALAVGAFFLQTGMDSGEAILLLPALVIASGMLGRNLIWYVFPLIVGVLGTGFLAQLQQVEPITYVPQERAVDDFLVPLLMYAISFVIILVFNNRVQYIAERAQADFGVFEHIGEYAPQVSRAETDTELVQQTIRFLRSELKISFGQFYATDSTGHVRRRIRATFGKETNTEIEENIELGDLSIITQAARSRKIQRASLDSLPIRRKNFLPSSNFGLAIPVAHNDNMLGVLDVQLTRSVDFSEAEVSILTAIANSLGVALYTLQSLRTLRADIAEQREINASLRAKQTALNEIKPGLNEYWETYFQDPDHSTFGLDGKLSANHFVEATELTPQMKQVLSHSKSDVHIVKEKNKSILNIPIMQNERLLGFMTFELPPDRIITDREMETARIISQRLAMALENKRLFEESQARANRERKASETANALMGATDVRSVMERAIEQFNNLLGAINTEIHIQTADFGSYERSEDSL